MVIVHVGPDGWGLFAITHVLLVDLAPGVKKRVGALMALPAILRMASASVNQDGRVCRVKRVAQRGHTVKTV